MEYKILEFSIVLLGEIPTTLFTPTWLSKHKLISKEEGEKADLRVISPQVTNYSIAEWGNFIIQPKRLTISTLSDSHHEVIRDIILSILRVLEGNDITNVGINHNFHFKLDKKQYLKIGKILAPFENWKGILEEPRMLNLEMIQNSRSDKYSGRYTIRVQPSTILGSGGVSFNFNNHFNRKGDMAESAQEFSETINESWENCNKVAHDFFTTFLKNVNL